MKNTLLLLSLICLASAMNSCETSCGSPDIQIHFIGYDSAANSLCVERRYAKGTNYGQLVDTTIYSSTLSAGNNTGDTLLMLPSTVLTVTDKYDLMFVYPSIGRSYKVHDITLNATKLYTKHCTNGLCYFLDETKMTVPSHAQSDAIAEIDVYR